MKKLVLVFDEDSVINNVDRCLIFDNEKNATDFLMNNKVLRISFYDYYFTFDMPYWSGRGQMFWAELIQ